MELQVELEGGCIQERGTSGLSLVLGYICISFPSFKSYRGRRDG